MMIPDKEENIDKTIDEGSWDLIWKCEKPNSLINEIDHLNCAAKRTKPPLIKLARKIDKQEHEDVHRMTL